MLTAGIAIVRVGARPDVLHSSTRGRVATTTAPFDTNARSSAASRAVSGASPGVDRFHPSIPPAEANAPVFPSGAIAPVS